VVLNAAFSAVVLTDLFLLIQMLSVQQWLVRERRRFGFREPSKFPGTVKGLLIRL